MMFKNTDFIISGVQPSGDLHLGNYLGAIRQYVALQEQAECLFFIADLHALTQQPDPAALQQSVLQTAAAYLACGVNPDKAGIYVQSTVSGHAELAWLLNCHTTIGKLNRMTQFKEKAGKNKEKANLGLYAYPVLMAADILLYQTTHVPVGDDQKQHLELTRDIASVVNEAFSQDVFTVPEPVILPAASRIMSLRDGAKKMSKSDSSAYSRLTLVDDADTIVQKIRKAKTDPHPLPENVQELENRPEAKNLLTIFAALSEQSLAAIVQQFAGQEFSSFKQQLAELVVEKFAPITMSYQQYLADPASLNAILQRGSDEAHERAAATIKSVREVFGLPATQRP